MERFLRGSTVIHTATERFTFGFGATFDCGLHVSGAREVTVVAHGMGLGECEGGGVSMHAAGVNNEILSFALCMQCIMCCLGRER